MNRIYASTCSPLLLLPLLLLLLLCAAVSSPVPATDPGEYERLRDLAKTLLDNGRHLPKHIHLSYGINTDKVTLLSKKVVLACTPNQNQGCINSSVRFREDACLMAIMDDLHKYEATFQSYANTDISGDEKAALGPTLDAVRSLREHFSLIQSRRSDSSEYAAVKWGSDSFNNRLKMMKIVNGFLGRVILYNRAISYICSGDHKK